jgi:hypothetical protein
VEVEAVGPGVYGALRRPLCMRELPSCLGIFWISSITVPAIIQTLISLFFTSPLYKDAREMRGRKRGGGGSWSRSLRGTPEADARMGTGVPRRLLDQLPPPPRFLPRISLASLSKITVMYEGRGTPEADARMGISPEIRKRNKNETPGKFEYRIDIVGCILASASGVPRRLLDQLPPPPRFLPRISLASLSKITVSSGM